MDRHYIEFPFFFPEIQCDQPFYLPKTAAQKGSCVKVNAALMKQLLGCYGLKSEVFGSGLLPGLVYQALHCLMPFGGKRSLQKMYVGTMKGHGRCCATFHSGIIDIPGHTCCSIEQKIQPGLLTKTEKCLQNKTPTCAKLQRTESTKYVSE